ncbi:MAG: UDP-N-acetylmuramyl tripeptide synthetase, partial [Schumannella sp.]|nr:UDP-N-acetylmuramyl tripeptide synthetase [Schumannella sp.]
RTALAVLTGRAIRVLARLRGGGSAFPGRVALLIAPGFLQRAVSRLPLGVVFVSGSNGKSTTTGMLTGVLRAHGVDVFTNPSGANLPQGIASAILADAPLDGRLRHEIAVLEVDEAFGPGLAKRLVPHSVLLINVQVDQLNRFYEPDRVVGMLESFAGVATRHLVVNADDHNLVALAHRLSASGAELSAFALAPELLAESSWLARGDNPALATATPTQLPAATVVTAASGATATISVDGTPVAVALPARGLHNAVDAAAAFAMARALLGDRFDPELGARGLAAMETVYGRGEVLKTPAGEELEILMMKNPPSLQVNLDALAEAPEQVFVAIDEGTPDPSWVYGSDLSKLTHVDVLSGTKCWQFATRFAYDDIDVHAVEPELAPALKRFLEMPPPVHGRKTLIVNYEQMMLIRKHLGYLELEGAP